MKRNYSIYRFIILCYLLFISNVLFAEYISDEQYIELASKFYSWEKGNENDSLLRQQINDEYMERALESYTHNLEYEIAQNGDGPFLFVRKILVIVKQNVYSSMPEYIIRYAHDIHNAYGYAIDVISINGETAPEVRSLIKSSNASLNVSVLGAVLIGDIANIYYYHPDSIVRGDTIWKEERFPCDLYYMDLDGDWALKSGEWNTYDKHTNGTGDVEPEIFVGRINTSKMDRGEINKLKHYLNRNHDYWIGRKALNKGRALTFIGPDWDDNWNEFRSSVAPLYGTNYYDAVYGYGFNKGNYCSYLQNDDYEFIQLACHSYYSYHNFYTQTDPILHSREIDSLYTKSIGYNLYCCSACNWRKSLSSPCLGESYLYGNNNSEALALVGSTKTGSMLGFSDFYTPLGNGNSIGYAFKNWWHNHCGTEHSMVEVHWFYGMVILGDPLVNFNYTNDCDDVLYLNEGEESTNSMYYAQNQIIVQNYSTTQGQSVTLSAPSVQITGPFMCDSSTLYINPFDQCYCNNGSTRQNMQNRMSSASTAPNKNEKTSSVLISLYPNPARDVLTIEMNEELAMVVLYNQQGQCVLRSNNSKINVAPLPVGIYVVYITTKSGKTIQSRFFHN